MRNGNPASLGLVRHFLLCSYRTYEEWKPNPLKEKPELPSVLTVPMRNGNQKMFLELEIVVISSYRTYEEWKQIWYNNMCSGLLCSYRTYEEWKLAPEYCA